MNCNLIICKDTNFIPKIICKDTNFIPQKFAAETRFPVAAANNLKNSFFFDAATQSQHICNNERCFAFIFVMKANLSSALCVDGVFLISIFW